MVLYDIEAIKANADPYDVARSIGIPMKEGRNIRTRRGRVKRTNYILCPGHQKRLGKADRHFGSCMLTEHGYICHACNARVDVIDMVMEYLECGFHKALEIVADVAGGKENYVLEGEARTARRFPLNVDEMKLIGLYPYRTVNVDYPVNAGDNPYLSDLPSKKYVKEDVEEYLYYNTESIPMLSMLYDTDKRFCQELVQDKVKEKLEGISSIEKILDRSSPFFNIFTVLTKGEDGYWEDDELFLIKLEFKKMRDACSEILRKIRA